MDETVALVSLLPAEFTGRKSSYWRLGYQLVQDSIHQNSHLEQIKTALKAAILRNSSVPHGCLRSLTGHPDQEHRRQP